MILNDFVICVLILAVVGELLAAPEFRCHPRIPELSNI
jgi:hypothetical protein